MLTDDLPATYPILNDPATGIRLPGEQNQADGRTHISLRLLFANYGLVVLSA